MARPLNFENNSPFLGELSLVIDLEPYSVHQQEQTKLEAGNNSLPPKLLGGSSWSTNTAKMVTTRHLSQKKLCARWQELTQEGHCSHFVQEGTEAWRQACCMGSEAIPPDFKSTVSAREVAAAPVGLGASEADPRTRL